MSTVAAVSRVYEVQDDPKVKEDETENDGEEHVVVPADEASPPLGFRTSTAAEGQETNAILPPPPPPPQGTIGDTADSTSVSPRSGSWLKNLWNRHKASLSDRKSTRLNSSH